MAWTVKLVKNPTPFLYKNDYFPRTFAYKKDAVELKKQVENKGGEAQVVKESK